MIRNKMVANSAEAFMKGTIAGILLAVCVCAHAQEKMAMKATLPAFEQMKSLAGEWTGVLDGKAVLTGTIRTVSSGTALEEQFDNATQHMHMVTLYTPDGDKLAMTHYCDAGNQPHMETSALSANDTEFRFKMTSIGNLAKPSEGHMVALTLSVQDKDHYTEVWTWYEAGKTGTSVFHFTRKT
jgi:hypothetical protein